jgi:hypothetical protein
LNIVGLGKTGCDIVNSLCNLGPYRPWLIDTRKHRKKSFKLEKHTDPELYESSFPDLNKFFSSMKGEACLILSGSDYESSGSLALLQQLKQATGEEPKILYVKDSPSGLSLKQSMHHRMVMGVLQQYARSGLVDRMFLASCDNIASFMQQVPVSKYRQSLLDIICYGFHMYNVFHKSEPLIKSTPDTHATAKISTIGFYDYEKNQKNMFFSLEIPRQIDYYYLVSNKKLESDESLLSKVKTISLESSKEKTESGYSIYSTKDDDDMSLVVHLTTLIQEQDL